MNERIRELAEQAGFYYTDKTGFITPAGCDPAKFAELIVKECIQVLKDTGYPNAHGNCVGVEELKQHFGVEE